MCGRYYIDSEVYDDVRTITDYYSPNINWFRTGDIHPTEDAVVSRKENNRLIADDMNWGFRSYDKKLLINARSETALEKKTFADSVRYRRCIIPARHFYEWDSQKAMNTFTIPDKRTIYMAGIYNMFDNVPKFTILTTAANESMRMVHDRMPLILPKDLITEWIMNGNAAAEYLSRTSPLLERKAEYEQLSLFQ